MYVCMHACMYVYMYAGLSKEVGKQSSELRMTFTQVTSHHITIHHEVTLHDITIHHEEWCEKGGVRLYIT